MKTVEYIQAEQFDSVLANNELVVFDFTATWCGPCKMIAPMIDKLAQEYSGRATVLKVDLDQNQSLAKRLSIRSIPAVMIYKNGTLMETIVGVKSYETFTASLAKLL
ncbi:thioredoxin [Aetokthonos hydrillicola Thurmond2011]|jgi:thioredoxin 1|uniref:Thioredoxin n=1 Tax=Aetokthonos hydrillicola Thurmond2011 TaxID=2712845 RepID=A0AAP5IGG8_9CYAN|nr:thioredoxin [Aetokthonos hydrillicola]MBO3459596.1 thioredoxin [Aetokthonos hydrillicola CCALA 1050]MBW4590962.1 thioredoxin [Aetokthonos hydrillicola CCALA 1050]MDR9899368.1 thioredoxin [Aetokthonos hydrillicola Thurmond2011]